MTDVKRHAHNLGKIIAMSVFAVIALAAVVILFFWPMVLWTHFGQPLAVAVALTVIWILAAA